MTGLQRWRTLARSLILALVTWDVITTLGGIVLLALLVLRGGKPTPEALVELAGAIGLSAVILWAIGDARKRGRQRPAGPEAPSERPR